MKAQSIFLLLALLTQHPSLWAEEKDPVLIKGSKAHQNHCYKCHTDQVYVRENHFVKSISALGKQVRMCKDNNNVPWFDDDTDAVIHFLNKKHYKF
jgi:hypothetical protein